jgi:hypothetical protein
MELPRAADEPPDGLIGLIGHPLCLRHWPLPVFFGIFEFAPPTAGRRANRSDASRRQYICNDITSPLGTSEISDQPAVW